jgi:hypothetical protein
MTEAAEMSAGSSGRVADIAQARKRWMLMSMADYLMTLHR